MQRVKKALAAALMAAASVLEGYLLTGKLDTQSLEAAVFALVSAAVAYGVVYLAKNEDAPETGSGPKAPKGEPR